MSKPLLQSVAIGICLALWGCSPNTFSSAIQGVQGLSEQSSTRLQTMLNEAIPSAQISNHFAQAIGKPLSSDADFDVYIDPAISGSDRILARRLLRLMPDRYRGDFIYYDGSRILSNNTSLLPYAHLFTKPSAGSPSDLSGGSQPTGIVTSTPQSAKRSTLSSSQCDPPYYPGSGPYIRDVGNCGYAGGWGIVNLECNTTLMVSPQVEAGYAYWELRNNQGGLYEGEIFTSYGLPNDNSINPYASASVGVGLQNGNVRFSCGQDIAIMAGVINPAPGNNAMFFETIGVIPNWNPSSVWMEDETVTIPNAAWLFTTLPNTTQTGNDSAGVPTPCTGCSISHVTSIAQHGDNWDGSFFGVDGYGVPSVHWEETVEGEWLVGCTHTSICNMEYTPNGSYWYAGQDVYASSTAAVSQFSPTGYVFESFDGVVATNGSGVTGVASNYRDPAPPTCGLDSYGYCIAQQSGSYSTGNFDCMTGRYYEFETLNTGTKYYLITNAEGTLMSFAATYDTALCTNPLAWNPGEPRVVTGDPNLP
jgi:hypothetical protein